MHLCYVKVKQGCRSALYVQHAGVGFVYRCDWFQMDYLLVEVQVIIYHSPDLYRDAYRPGNHANIKYGEMWKHLHVNIFFIKKEGVDPYWLCIKKKQELFKKWKRRKQNAISCHIEVLYIYKSNNCLLLDLWRTMANSCTQMQLWYLHK